MTDTNQTQTCTVVYWPWGREPSVKCTLLDMHLEPHVMEDGHIMRLGATDWERRYDAAATKLADALAVLHRLAAILDIDYGKVTIGQLGWAIGESISLMDAAFKTNQERAKQLVDALAAGAALEAALGDAGWLVSFLQSCIASSEKLNTDDLSVISAWRGKRDAALTTWHERSKV